MTLEERLAIAARLEDLTRKGKGRLTPEAVVKDAADKKSPLHSRIFRETDSEAAHAHRLELARQLIRSVRVNVTVEHRAVSVVGYVHDPNTSESGYVPTVSIVNEHQRAREVIVSEFARIEASINRAREIADVLGLEDDLDALLLSVQHIAERTKAAA